MRRLPFALFVLLLAVSALASATQAPDLEAPTVDGRQESLRDYRGQVVLLNFWATWCAPCRQEMPELVAAQAEWSSRGLVVIGFASNGESDRAEVRRFARDHGVNFPLWLGGRGRDLDRFQLSWAIPATVVIDRRGEVVETISGPVTRDRLRSIVEPLLVRDPAPPAS